MSGCVCCRSVRGFVLVYSPVPGWEQVLRVQRFMDLNCRLNCPVNWILELCKLLGHADLGKFGSASIFRVFGLSWRIEAFVPPIEWLLLLCIGYWTLYLCDYYYCLFSEWILLWLVKIQLRPIMSVSITSIHDRHRIIKVDCLNDTVSWLILRSI